MEPIILSCDFKETGMMVTDIVSAINKSQSGLYAYEDWFDDGDQQYITISQMKLTEPQRRSLHHR